MKRLLIVLSLCLSGGPANASQQTLTASGTWKRPLNVTKVWVTMVGGGGGGGSYALGSGITGGGGGGGGQTIIHQAFTVAADVKVTVGKGGTAGSGGGDGGKGGDSLFGAFAAAVGGQGGGANGGGGGGTSSVGGGRGGAGGATPGGSAGGTPWYSGGGGGSSGYGQGGAGANGNGAHNGGNGGGYGAGGGGGSANACAGYSACSGGAGSPGFVTIEWSDVGLGPAITWTDPILTPGLTPVRKIHADELRSNIDAARQAAGLAAYNWSDPSLAAGGSGVRATHVLEMRAAISEVYAQAGQAAPTWTDPALAAGMPVRAVHITDLRAAVQNAPTAAACVSDPLSCNAPAPPCEQTTSGTDNCGNPCTKTGSACPVACDWIVSPELMLSDPGWPPSFTCPVGSTVQAGGGFPRCTTDQTSTMGPWYVCAQPTQYARACDLVYNQGIAKEPLGYPINGTLSGRTFTCDTGHPRPAAAINCFWDCQDYVRAQGYCCHPVP